LDHDAKENVPLRNTAIIESTRRFLLTVRWRRYAASNIIQSYSFDLKKTLQHAVTYVRLYHSSKSSAFVLVREPQSTVLSGIFSTSLRPESQMEWRTSIHSSHSRSVNTFYDPVTYFLVNHFLSSAPAQGGKRVDQIRLACNA
jgi:hypothetical protein